MPSHPLSYFEIQKYHQNEPKFNDIYSRNNLPKKKDGAYVINVDKYKSRGNHWIALYVNDNNGSASYDATYFYSFVVERIPKEIKQINGNKIIITNTYRIQAYNLVMCGHFCIEFIDFVLKGKSLLD